MEKRNMDDLLDDFFDEIENDSATFKSSSTNDFEKKVKTSFESALNSDSFKNVASLVNDGIMSLKKTVLEEDKPLFNFEITRMDTRLDYVKNALNSASFDIFHRGQYKVGYYDGIVYFLHQMEVSKYDLVTIEQDLKRAIKKERWESLGKGDRYNDGYKEGLKYLKETLKNSKEYMMKKIKADMR